MADGLVWGLEGDGSAIGNGVCSGLAGPGLGPVAGCMGLSKLLVTAASSLTRGGEELLSSAYGCRLVARTG